MNFNNKYISRLLFGIFFVIFGVFFVLLLICTIVYDYVRYGMYLLVGVFFAILIGSIVYDYICYGIYLFKWRNFNKTKKTILADITENKQWETTKLTDFIECIHKQSGLVVRITNPTITVGNYMYEMYSARYIYLTDDISNGVKFHYRPKHQVGRSKNQWYLLVKNIIEEPEKYMKQLKIQQHNREIERLLKNI